MSLEKTLEVLELAMNNKFDGIDESSLENPETEKTLTTYLTESEVRPELLSLIEIPTLMYDYLNLDLEDRQELEKFNQDSSEYLEGERCDGRIIVKIKNKKARSLSQKTRFAKQLLKFFDFYLKNRKELQVFNQSYLRKEFGNNGELLYRNARRNLKQEGDFQHLIQLTTQQRPEIKNYTSKKEVLRSDGTKQLIKFFDFYLGNRDESKKFNPTYLRSNKKFEEKFGKDGEKLYRITQRNFREEGGINYIVQLAAEERPEILEHWKYNPRQLTTLK